MEILSLPQLKELQQFLAKRGFDVGKIDGVIGASTLISGRRRYFDHHLVAAQEG